MSSSVKKRARQFSHQYITETLTAEAMKAALQQQGYTVVSFHAAYNDGPTAAIIEALHLQDYVRASKGFTYADSQHRLVFLHEGLSAREELLILLHEQGHISCDHMTTHTIMGQDVLQEHEANEFAHYVLHPGFFTKVGHWMRRHKRLLLIAGAVLLCLAIGLGVWAAISGSNGKDTFYITHTGSKYHTQDCIFIRGKDGLTEMTPDQVKSSGYEPCEVCNPK